MLYSPNACLIIDTVSVAHFPRFAQNLMLFLCRIHCEVASGQPDILLQIRGRKNQHDHPHAWNLARWFPRYATILPSTVASRCYNYSRDGSISPCNYGYTHQVLWRSVMALKENYSFFREIWVATMLALLIGEIYHMAVKMASCANINLLSFMKLSTDIQEILRICLRNLKSLHFGITDESNIWCTPLKSGQTA
jgi:hypothetical protein